MILRNREIVKQPEMFEIIDEAEVCHVAMVNQQLPYILPMNFARDGSDIYFHCDNHGTKLDILAVNPNVCINFNTGNELFYRHKEVGCSWGMKYKSINIFGKVEQITDYDEKYRIMKLFMLKYAHEDYEFSEPAIRNIHILKVIVEHMTGKKYGY